METNPLTQLRDRLYSVLRRRADTTMDLLDALASDQAARSPIELSLSPQFRRRWSSLPDAVDAFFSASRPQRAAAERVSMDRDLVRALAPLVPEPTPSWPFRLFALDTLPVSRPYAERLEDRSWVHQAAAIPGRKPLTVGHEVSLLVALSERAAGEPAWTLGLSAQRVPSTVSATTVGADQVRDLASDRQLPWAGQLQVIVADSRYSTAAFLAPVELLDDVVVVARLRSNRVLYHPPPPRQSGQRGRPKRYGPAFRLGDADTWGPPAATITLATTLGRRAVRVELTTWTDLILPGEIHGRRHCQTVSLVRAVVLDEAGERVYPRDLWLVVVGERRAEIDAATAYAVYRGRFDQEHGHRFWRQRLLFDAYQTSQVEHEENWHRLVMLAHAQLYAARHLAECLPRPWEHQPSPGAEPVLASPTQVQRDFSRILAVVGTPAAAPKRRGNSPGRSTGQSPGRRKRLPVYRSGRKAA